jgi:hypothetical protein
VKLGLGLARDNRRIFWAVLFDEGAVGVFMTLMPLCIASLGASPAQIGLTSASPASPASACSAR